MKLPQLQGTLLRQTVNGLQCREDGDGRRLGNFDPCRGVRSDIGRVEIDAIRGFRGADSGEFIGQADRCGGGKRKFFDPQLERDQRLIYCRNRLLPAARFNLNINAAHICVLTEIDTAIHGTLEIELEQVIYLTSSRIISFRIDRILCIFKVIKYLAVILDNEVKIAVATVIWREVF